MGLKTTAYKVAMAVFCLGLLAPASHAQNEPELAPAAGPVTESKLAPFTLKGRYILAWNGITVGRIIATIGEDEKTYHMSIDTKTKGLGALMSDEKSLIEASGTKNAHGDYIQSKFSSTPTKKGDDDIITLTYDDKGNIVKRVRTKDDDPTWRPPVPNEKINTAHDPLTGIFILRRALRDALAANQHEVNTRSYDGMRLADVKFIRIPNARVAVMDKYIDTIGVSVRREPIDGYTPKELKKYKKGDPEIRFYFSNDDKFLPVSASAQTGFGAITLTLVDDTEQ